MAAIGKSASRCPFKILVVLVIAYLSNLFAGWTEAVPNLAGSRFEPKTLHELYEGQEETLQLQVRLTSVSPDDLSNVTVHFDVRDVEIARLSSASESVVVPFCTHIIETESPVGLTTTTAHQLTTTKDVDIGKPLWSCVAHVNVSVTGVFLGKTTLSAELRRAHMVKPSSSVGSSSDDGRLDVGSADVWVIRDAKLMTYLFIGTLTVLIALANFMMGCELHLDMVRSVIRRPVAPAIGLFCQFVFMPSIAYGLARLLFDGETSSVFGLGVFTNGCSPGGGASNMWTVLLDGNLDLSVTMTFISTLFSLVTLPVWLFFLGDHFLHDAPGTSTKIRVPYRNICTSLLVLIVPLLIGVLYRKFREKSANKMKKCLRPFFLLVILFICTFGVYANLYMFRVFNWRIIVAGLTLPWCGYAAGAIAALLVNQPRANVLAIMIETGVQNSGIAIVLLKTSFGEPTGDLASVVPVAMSMFTPLPMVGMLLLQSVLKRDGDGSVNEVPTEDGNDNEQKKMESVIEKLNANNDVERPLEAVESNI